MTKITTLYYPKKAYTIHMVFAHVTEAPKPRTKTSLQIGLFFAVLLLGMAVTQLFGFEKFIPVIESYQLPGGHVTAVTLASLIVVLEVFALPFLLRMRLSPLMRLLSMACGILVGTTWLKLIFWTNFADTAVLNAGFFGTRMSIPLGGWAVIYPLLLLLLAGWSIWGLGPWRKSPSQPKA